MHFFHLQTAGYHQPHLCALCAPYTRLLAWRRGQRDRHWKHKERSWLWVHIKKRKKNPHITQHRFCLFAWSAWKGLRSAPDMHWCFQHREGRGVSAALLRLWTDSQTVLGQPTSQWLDSVPILRLAALLQAPQSELTYKWVIDVISSVFLRKY